MALSEIKTNTQKEEPKMNPRQITVTKSGKKKKKIKLMEYTHVYIYTPP